MRMYGQGAQTAANNRRRRHGGSGALPRQQTAALAKKRRYVRPATVGSRHGRRPRAPGPPAGSDRPLGPRFGIPPQTPLLPSSLFLPPTPEPCAAAHVFFSIVVAAPLFAIAAFACRFELPTIGRCSTSNRSSLR